MYFKVGSREHRGLVDPHARLNYPTLRRTSKGLKPVIGLYELYTRKPKASGLVGVKLGLSQETKKEKERERE